jgi:hypothetical protein
MSKHCEVNVPTYHTHIPSREEGCRSYGPAGSFLQPTTYFTLASFDVIAIIEDTAKVVICDVVPLKALTGGEDYLAEYMAEGCEHKK